MLTVDGGSYVMMTQLAAAVPTSALAAQVAWLGDARYAIIAALDLLVTGV